MKPTDNVKNLMARMKVAKVPEDLRRDMEATLLDLKAAEVDAKLEAAKRRYSDPVATDDLGAALATVTMAIAAALGNLPPGGITTAALLGKIQRELDETKVVLRDPNGEVLPAGRAVGYAAGMLHLSDPEQIPRAQVSQGTEICITQTVCNVALTRWPRNTAAHLAKRAGTGKRSAQYWLENGGGMSAEAFAHLLRSDAGLEILEAVMGDAKPRWWTGLQGLADRLETIRVEIEAAKRGLS